MDMMVVMYIYCFVIGCCVASFINVVIWRVPNELSIAKGRSFCPNCKHQLSWYDLFPIFSYLCLKGKCRYCGAKIPYRDTVIEILGGFIAIWCFHHFMFQWDSLIVFAIAMILLAITMIDFDTMTIPNGLIIALVIPVGMMTVLHLDISLINRMIGLLIISVPMYILVQLIPDCFGGGDIKLIAVCGFLLGWTNTLLAFFIAILICGLYAIYLLVSGKAKKRSHIAFGPYIVIGVMIALLYGNQLIDLYLSLFKL